MGARHNQTPNEMRRMLKMALKSNYAITFEISKPFNFFLFSILVLTLYLSYMKRV